MFYNASLGVWKHERVILFSTFGSCILQVNDYVLLLLIVFFALTQLNYSCTLTPTSHYQSNYQQALKNVAIQ